MNNKTNKFIYPYEIFGSWYRLDNGELVTTPMNADGSIPARELVDDEMGHIDWEMLKGEKTDKGTLITDELKKIVKELEGKE